MQDFDKTLTMRAFKIIRGKCFPVGCVLGAIKKPSFGRWKIFKIEDDFTWFMRTK